MVKYPLTFGLLVVGVLTGLLVIAVQGVRSNKETVRRVERGERLFSGCPQGVDEEATRVKGEFVCKGSPDPAPFGGNGRSCGTCHVPGDRFGMAVTRVATLEPSHPFFFGGIDEDQELLHTFGLIHVVDADEDGLNEFRHTPKLVQIRTLCNPQGECEVLGLLGDRETNLCQFSREAVANHLSKTVARVEGRDFRRITDAECRDLIAFMRSKKVSGE